jgi:hypothetical protein
MSTASARLAVAAIGLFALAGWLLQHPYDGVIHDATIYSLLGLARLHPDTLANDVFLRFGSQDRYTLFSPIYSQAIAAFGLEPAAALLTFTSHMAILGCAWLVARRFMPALTATFAVALLVVLPGAYGSGAFFAFLEGFLTPRLPAEALVLAAVAATLARRYGLAVLALVAATLLHPIMAAAGIAMIALTFIAPAKPRLTAIAGVVLVLVSVAFLEAVAPLGRFDSAWLEVIHASSPYLYVTAWFAGDWTRAAVPLALLGVGALQGTAPALRKVCAGTLLTVACGLGITWLYCDLLNVALLTDLQSWRWLWLANVLAVLLSPVICGECWRSGSAGRAAVVLLGAAWIVRGDSAALYLVGAALACTAIRPGTYKDEYLKLVFFGSCALLMTLVVIDLGGLFAYVPAKSVASASLPQQLRAVCSDGVIPGALLIFVWLWLARATSMQRLIPLAATAGLVCICLVPMGWASWTNAGHARQVPAQFAQWRAEIPPNAEVLWSEAPVNAWYLLDRASYWSLDQTAGAIFSREKALTLRKRTASINAALREAGVSDGHDPLATAGLVGPADAAKLTPQALRAVCADPALGYVVSWLRLGKTTIAPVLPDPARPNSRLYLYRCADLKSG